jgi:uncharacterized Rmd1/YagE family protein
MYNSMTEKTKLLGRSASMDLTSPRPTTAMMRSPLDNSLNNNEFDMRRAPSPGAQSDSGVIPVPVKNRKKPSKNQHVPLPPAAGHMPMAAGRRRRIKPAQAGEHVSDAEDETSAFVPIATTMRRVYSVCIAQELDMKLLLQSLEGASARTQTFNEEVVHVRLSSWARNSDAFLLPTYGTVVLWNVPLGSEKLLLNIMRQSLTEKGDDSSPTSHIGTNGTATSVSSNLLENPPDDTFDYMYIHNDAGDDRSAHLRFRIENNTLLLPIDTPERDLKHWLACSYGLATSVKLDSFELAISKTIEVTSHIPEELARDGHIALTKKEVSQYIGELYIQKASVNLMFDILDAPDFFWDEDELALIYKRCRKMLDIDQRVEVLNRRLDVLAELLAILREEKSEQNSHRLELVVIWLIVVEILLGVSTIAVTYI